MHVGMVHDNQYFKQKLSYGYLCLIQAHKLYIFQACTYQLTQKLLIYKSHMKVHLNFISFCKVCECVFILCLYLQFHYVIA